MVVQVQAPGKEGVGTQPGERQIGWHGESVGEQAGRLLNFLSIAAKAVAPT
ncbi:hypothetical protein [Amycolatopsis thailandensis]|uniref:hypothetical protein n=1 Tax=Amycolatopsis thailandensis TaxID=589330 RepID=UPI0036441738